MLSARFSSRLRCVPVAALGMPPLTLVSHPTQMQTNPTSILYLTNTILV